MRIIVVRCERPKIMTIHFQDRFVATLTDDNREWESFRFTSPTRAVNNVLRLRRRELRHRRRHHTSKPT